MRLPNRNIGAILSAGALLFGSLGLGGCGDETTSSGTGGTGATAGTGGAGGMGGSGGSGGMARSAVATIDTGTGITGTVTFMEMTDGVHVSATFAGFDASKPSRGFHVHQSAMCGGDHTTAGGHWNPAMAPHACPPTEPRHAGDLGNVTLSGTEAKAEVHLTGITFDDITSNHAVILHDNPDDCTTQDPPGNAGSRIGCAPIVVQGR